MPHPDRSAYAAIIGPERREQIIAHYAQRLAEHHHLKPHVARQMATEQVDDGLAEPIACVGQVWTSPGSKGRTFRCEVQERGYGRSMVGGMWVSFGPGGLTSIAMLNSSYQLAEWGPSLPFVPPTPLRSEDNYVLRTDDVDA